MTDIFPAHLFNPRSIKVSLAGNVITSPPTISGQTQVLRTDGGGLWVCQMSDILLRTPAQVRGWRAWLSELAGGATIVNVPVIDIRQAPYVRKPTVIRNDSVDPYFSDNGPYGGNRSINASISASPLRASQATITMETGGLVQFGTYFGIIHASGTARVYHIKRIVSRNGMAATVTFEPPLREAVANATAVDFEWPVFAGRLVPQGDYYPNLALGRATVSIAFQEAFE